MSISSPPSGGSSVSSQQAGNARKASFVSGPLKAFPLCNFVDPQWEQAKIPAPAEVKSEPPKCYMPCNDY